MRLIVTDRVAFVCLFVGRSVGLSQSSATQTHESIEMSLGYGLRWAQGTMC